MTNKLYELILMKAVNINVNDGSELEIGRFQGMVEAYNMMNENEIHYEISGKNVFTIGTSNILYIWNQKKLSFDYRMN